MKRIVKKTKGLIKGAPTAVLFSAVIHLILFAVFGGMVVFSVMKKMERKFTPPPPVERPKMELKKPKCFTVDLDIASWFIVPLN